jgi:hypothetical protein
MLPSCEEPRSLDHWELRFGVLLLTMSPAFASAASRFFSAAWGSDLDPVTTGGVRGPLRHVWPPDGHLLPVIYPA